MKYNDQTGSAAIYFIFIIGVIFSIGILSLEGARYIGKKARLGDGLEAAAIAVAVNDRVHSQFDEKKSISIADKWVEKYIPDSKNIEVTVVREEKNQKFGKDSLVTPYEIDYFHYDIRAVTTHDSWFKFESWASFEKEQKVANTGSSARIKGSHQPVDIVFVADYSGSMNKKINDSDHYNKIEYLKRAVTGVTDKIHKLHDRSTFGFIPFTKRIVVKNENNEYFCTSPLLATEGSYFDIVRGDPTFYALLSLKNETEREVYYNNRPRVYGYKEKLVAEYYIKLIKSRYYKNKGDSYYKSNDSYKEYLKAIGDTWDSKIKKSRNLTSTRYAGTFKIDEPEQDDHIVGLGDLNENGNKHIDIKRSAKEISTKRRVFFPMSIQYGLDYGGGDKPDISRLCTSTRRNGVPYFYMLERKNKMSEYDIKAFNQEVNAMQAGGGTDMYQGLLAAPNEFDGATNKNRYIIVLSDGEENGGNFKKLVENGLCKNIKTRLEENGKYNSKLFVVGIGLNQNKNKAYRECFKENIITVLDPEELEKRIMGIITDDSGHNFERK